MGTTEEKLKIGGEQLKFHSGHSITKPQFSGRTRKSESYQAEKTDDLTKSLSDKSQALIISGTFKK